jgi:hypothetical protein
MEITQHGFAEGEQPGATPVGTGMYRAPETLAGGAASKAAGSVAKFRHGRRASKTLRYPETLRRLDFEPFTDDCDGLRERTGTETESAFDDARLAADVSREVEDRRLALP